MRANLLYNRFREVLPFDATPCQDKLFRSIAEFVTSAEQVMVVDGYAGTGKTSALASVIQVLGEEQIHQVLMAPTGRAAKVLSRYSHMQAYTVHKCIYRQKSIGENGMGQFSLAPNKDKNTLYIVDEVSLIGSFENGDNLFGTGDLLRDLLDFVERGSDCKVILVGDSAQLPPVGMERSPALDPNVMKLCGAARFCTLTTVVRQKEAASLIVEDATLLRNIILEERQVTKSDLALLAAPEAEVERVDGSGLIEAIQNAYSRYGEDETVILCRSNKRAIRYNAGIRSMVQYKEERLTRGDRLMVVKNSYHFVEGKVEGLDYVANGEIVRLERIRHFENRYGLEFADAELSLPDCGGISFQAKVILDTLSSESPSLTPQQANYLYTQVDADYSDIKSRRKRYEAVRSDDYYAAIQLKYAEAITVHKSQGGQWDCVFIDNPFWQDDLDVQDIKWLYTAITRGVKKVYLVNFNDSCFNQS
ncbi:MAG: AAA family ATPase [Bacteroidales bacterium]|nr:AAA family ATPase [Bacteroidales bacterium]